MHKVLRKWVATSELFSFNLVLRDRFIAEQAKRLFQGSRVLDIGAGPCPYRAFFSHCDYKAQDFSVLEGERLRYGSYGDIDYVCDATAIPVSDGSFDVVVCTEVLEHHPEPIRVVKEIARVLTSGGRLTHGSIGCRHTFRAVSLLWRLYTLLVSKVFARSGV